MKKTRYDELIDFVDMLIDSSMGYCEFEVTLRNHERWMNKWRDENGKDDSI